MPRTVCVSATRCTNPPPLPAFPFNITSSPRRGNAMLRAAAVASLTVLGFVNTLGAAEPAADVVRIPIECEDMKGVEWGPQGFTPKWTAGKWGRDLYQNMIFGGVWSSRLANAITDGGDA